MWRKSNPVSRPASAWSAWSVSLRHCRMRRAERRWSRLLGRSAPPTFAAELISPRESRLASAALENMFKTLCGSPRPFSLEFVGEKHRRAVLCRSATKEGLDTLLAHLRSFYPQLRVRPLSGSAAGDPLCLAPDELVETLALVLREPEYVPLATPGALPATGAPARVGTRGWPTNASRIDPVEAIASEVYTNLPGLRLISQLAIESWESGAWSRPYRRLALEDPLKPDDDRERRRALAEAQRARSHDRSEASVPAELGYALVAAIALLSAWKWWERHSEAQLSAFLSGMLALLLAGVGVVAWQRLSGRREDRLVDPRLVAQKIDHPAAATVLTLIAIGKRPPAHSGNPDASLAALAAYRQTLRRELERIGAAYQQFDLAAGNSFLVLPVCRDPRRLPARSRCFSPYLRYGLCRAAKANPYLTARELPLLWHFPAREAEIAHLPRTSFTELPVSPPAVAQGCPIGIAADEHGEEFVVHLSADVYRRHILVLAKTGAGKSTLYERMIRYCAEQLAVYLTALPPTHPAHPDYQPLLDVDTRNGERASQRAPSALKRMPPAPEVPIVIEHHSELCAHVIGQMPPALRHNVIYIDLGDTAHPLSFNILDPTVFPDRAKLVEDVLRVLKHASNERGWGDRMADGLRYCLATLHAVNVSILEQNRSSGRRDPLYTLLDIIPLLTNEALLLSLLGRIPAELEIAAWWRAEYFTVKSLTFREERFQPIHTKINRFRENPVIANIFGQPFCTIDMAGLLQRGCPLVINLASSQVGGEVAALAGSIFLGMIELTLRQMGHVELGPGKEEGGSAWSPAEFSAEPFLRSDPPPPAVVPPAMAGPYPAAAPSSQSQKTDAGPAASLPFRYKIFLDEFQGIPGVSYPELLGELRKYRVGFVLATQSTGVIKAMQAYLLDQLLPNFTTLCVLTCGARDATELLDELGDSLTVCDLVNLPDHWMYVRTRFAGSPLPTFSCRTPPPLPVSWESARQISERCSLTLGESAARVAFRRMKRQYEYDRLLSSSAAGAGKGPGAPPTAHVARENDKGGTQKNQQQPHPEVRSNDRLAMPGSAGAPAHPGQENAPAPPDTTLLRHSAQALDALRHAHAEQEAPRPPSPGAGAASEALSSLAVEELLELWRDSWPPQHQGQDEAGEEPSLTVAAGEPEQGAPEESLAAARADDPSRARPAGRPESGTSAESAAQEAGQILPFVPQRQSSEPESAPRPFPRKDCPPSPGQRAPERPQKRQRHNDSPGRNGKGRWRHSQFRPQSGHEGQRRKADDVIEPREGKERDGAPGLPWT